MSIHRHWFTDHLAQPGDRVAFESQGETRSYRDLAQRAAALAGGLVAAGVKPGDRVAAVGSPSLWLIEAMLATYHCGAIWVPINPRYREEERNHVLSDSGAKLEVAPELELPAADPIDLVPREDTDAAMLIYTSGTTGRSKGVELSFSAIGSAIGALVDRWRWTETDVLSLHLPLFHVHGLCIGVHGTLLRRMRAIIHPRFDAAAVVEDFRRGATVFMGVPTMYTRLLEHLEADPAQAEPLRGARLFTAGSAALPAADLRRFEALTGHRILERYGMTETLITLSNPYEGDRREGSVGTPIAGVQVKIDDEGELLVQTPGMMTGYWERPEDTAAAFDGPWFRTGDIGDRDPDGYLRIVGRRSLDIINSGGFKIGGARDRGRVGLPLRHRRGGGILRRGSHVGRMRRGGDRPAGRGVNAHARVCASLCVRAPRRLQEAETPAGVGRPAAERDGQGDQEAAPHSALESRPSASSRSIWSSSLAMSSLWCRPVAGPAKPLWIARTVPSRPTSTVVG